MERTVGVPFRFVELANDVNAHMPDYVVRRLMGAFNTRRMAVSKPPTRTNDRAIGTLSECCGSG